MMMLCNKALYRTLTIWLLFLAASPLFLSAQTRELSSGWKFLPDPQAKYSVRDLPGTENKDWRSILVDRSWNAQFEDLRDYMGVAWYRTSFDVPQLETSRHTL